MKLDHVHPPKGTVRDWLDHRAMVGGVAIAFCDEDAPLSWAELQEQSAGLAAMLVSKGIAKGESVAILCPNGRAGVLATFATLYGGFRTTMINLAAGPDAVAYALEHSEARFAFVHPSAEPLFQQANVQEIERLDWITGTGALHDIVADDHALLMYTSGTTGRPKGVVHSHASLLAGGWTSAVAHQLGPQDRGFCVLPIYHINGLCVTVMGALVSGGSLGMAAKFSASQFWNQAAKVKATWFSVVPTIISHLLHNAADPSPETKARLRFGRSASSALSPDVQRAFETRFEVPIVETMGLTETSAQILSNPLPPGVRKIGSPGVAYGNEVAVFDTNMRPCAPEVEGEIVVRGPNIMREYLKNPEATAGTFCDGWLRTGDLGHVDADGYFFVTGRLKELIIKGGENIAPREIDEALYSHGDVIEAAAFARPCDSYGERVEAAVRVREGSPLSEAQLIEICHARLGKFKSPDTVYFMAELPKGPSGKIQRMKLRDLTD